MGLKRMIDGKSSHIYRVQYDNHGDYRFGTGISFIDGNILSGTDIERAVNGNPLPERKEDNNIWE